MKNTIYPQLVFLCVLVAFFGSCKKTGDTINPTQPQDSTTMAANQAALTASKDFYLWYKQIPSSFNALSYTDPNSVMIGLRAFSMEPGFNAPVDKWSFGVLKTDWNQLAGGIGDADNVNITGDFGLSVFFRVDGDLRVRLVQPQSPAGLAGIQRGWRITAINGSTNLTISNSTFIINSVSYSPSSTFTFLKPDGTSVNITLNAATYPQKTVYLDSIYTIGAKTVGYMVLNSFLGDITQIFNDFDQVMTNFANNNVTDIIIDLRYNGGGYVSVQEKLADYLAPNAANHSLMMKETYNDKHQNLNSTFYFNKLGTLNLNHLFVIVTSSTASASELLINNLTPYMTVKLIGPDNTGGKPVGYSPISVGAWYVFPLSFRSTNSVNYGGYFNGFTPDAIVPDGLDKNWGDVTESCLAETIKYINTGVFTPQGRAISKPDRAVISANQILDKASFKGMVDSRELK